MSPHHPAAGGRCAALTTGSDRAAGTSPSTPGRSPTRATSTSGSNARATTRRASPSRISTTSNTLARDLDHITDLERQRRRRQRQLHRLALRVPLSQQPLRRQPRAADIEHQTRRRRLQRPSAIADRRHRTRLVAPLAIPIAERHASHGLARIRPPPRQQRPAIGNGLAELDDFARPARSTARRPHRAPSARSPPAAAPSPGAASSAPRPRSRGRAVARLRHRRSSRHSPPPAPAAVHRSPRRRAAPSASDRSHGWRRRPTHRSAPETPDRAARPRSTDVTPLDHLARRPNGRAAPAATAAASAHLARRSRNTARTISELLGSRNTLGWFAPCRPRRSPAP